VEAGHRIWNERAVKITDSPLMQRAIRSWRMMLQKPTMRLQTPDEPSCSYKRCARRLDVLRPFIDKGSVGAELGVFKGSFIDHLLSLEPAKLYSVDPWHRAEANWPWAKGDPSTVNALADILRVFKSEIDAGQLVPLVEYSQNFLRDLDDNALDWVYIDSTHAYDQTRLELELSCAKVRPGGAIMGDDYNDDASHRHHGVYKAVNEFVAEGRLKLVVDGEFRQFVARPVSAI
jgi:Methyltransferase domain